MSFWGRKTKTYYSTQTNSITPAYKVPNSLVGAVSKKNITAGSDLTNCLKEIAANSLVGVLYKMSRNFALNKYSKYDMSTPYITQVHQFLSTDQAKTIVSQEEDISLSDIKEILTQTYAPFNVLYAVFNVLYDEYTYIPISGTLTHKNGNTTYIEEYPGYILIDDKKYYLVDYGLVEDTIKVTLASFKLVKEVTQQGPSYKEEYYYAVDDEKELEYDNSMNDTKAMYLYIEYVDKDDKHSICAYNVDSNKYPAISSIISKNQELAYPTIILRDGYNDYRENNQSKVKVYKKYLKRLNLDYDDLADQVNAKTVLNKETDSDKSYKNSLENIEDISLYFGLDITSNHQSAINYLYVLFNTMYKQTGSIIDNSTKTIQYKHDTVATKIYWDSITKEVINGRIISGQKYCSKCVEEVYSYNEQIGTTIIPRISKIRVLHLYKQLDNKYYHIIVKNLKYDECNNGHWSTQECPIFDNMHRLTPKDIEELKDNDETKSTNSFLVPLVHSVIRRHLGSIRGHDLALMSMQLVFHCRKHIRLPWYSSGWFTVFRIVISIVIIVCTYGTTTPWIIAANVAVNTAINILINILIALAIKLAIKYLCKVFSIEGAAYMIINMVADMVCTAIIAGSLSSIGSSTTTTVSTSASALGGTSAAASMSASYTVAATVPALTAGQAMAIAGGLNTIMNATINHQKFDLNLLANTLVAMAASSIASGIGGALGALTSTTTQLALNPDFMDALKTKDWSRAIMMSASSMASNYAIATQTNTPMLTTADWTSVFNLENGLNLAVNSISSAKLESINKKNNSLQNLQNSLNTQMKVLNRQIEALNYYKYKNQYLMDMIAYSSINGCEEPIISITF